MKKIERILSIIVLLLENEVIPATQLAMRFNVTKRTIFRDIETIEMAGFPIVSFTGRKGGYSLLNSFKLRTYTYTDAEKQDILSALQMKEHFIEPTDYQNTIKEKIHLMQLNQSKTATSPLISFISPTLHRIEIEKETKHKNTHLSNALQQHVKMTIEYVSNQGERTRRIIHPYELMLLNGSWYIHAYCEKRSAFRHFKVTRIRKLSTLEQTFELQKIPTKKEEVTGEWIKLSFKKNDLGKLYDYYTENEIQMVEDRIEVTFFSKHQDYLIPFLLMFGNEAQVITPLSLKKQHQEAIYRLQKTYSK
ncbi:transcriptional regulator [Carnobacterium divergens]|uniref:helix-turn-helix transcriptional regulator n=1 Tax=Carnobacterium divergens TaxID=2748 RepID=UPI00107203BC|nr:YafY family protein [Carnobacterium divergens]TFJ43039.1 transcriptional regulator [Carnobacterium divergens]TFJ50192.1 transcriptional regulator [Carnobacterium divergens]